MLPVLGLMLGLLALGASRRAKNAGGAPVPSASVPSGSVYRPEQGKIVAPDGREVDVPPGPAAPERALVPVTSAQPPAPTGPAPAVKQPPGTTGNLPNITRPLGRPGFNPELAAKLAPQVIASLRSGPQRYSKKLVIAFQKAADLDPADGVYGPRTAGALQYYAATGGTKATVPAPWTTDKRIIPYGI